MPPSIVSASLLSRIRQRPALPPQTWYLVAATALSALNLPHEVPAVYRHALSLIPSHQPPELVRDEQLRVTQRMREGLVKTIVVGGLPRVLSHSENLIIGSP